MNLKNAYLGYCTTKSLVMNTRKDLLNVKGITDMKLKNLIDALKKFDVKKTKFNFFH